MKIILIAILVIVAVIIIASVILEEIENKRSKNKSTSEQKNRPAYPPAKRWNDTPQRQSAARNAASEMSSHRVSNVDIDAVRIRRVICEKKLSINTQTLNEAVEVSAKLIKHAEQIRREVESHRTEPHYLQQLYRTGVGLSNATHTLRLQLKPMQDTMYKLSRTNPSLKPLYEQVHRLENTIYHNEVELNSRNRILRTYVRENFGPREREWALAIEKRTKARRSA